MKYEWVGFHKEEAMWQALEKVWDAAPQFVQSELCKLELERDV